MRFEWNETKAEMNLIKHGVSFHRACTVFRDPNILSVPDLLHSLDEERWVSLGVSETGATLVVIHTYRKWNGDEAVRLISARKASAREQRQYLERRI